MKIGGEGVCCFFIIVTPHSFTVKPKLSLFTSCKKIYPTVQISSLSQLRTLHSVQCSTNCGWNNTVICCRLRCGSYCIGPISGKILHILFTAVTLPVGNMAVRATCYIAGSIVYRSTVVCTRPGVIWSNMLMGLSSFWLLHSVCW